MRVPLPEQFPEPGVAVQQVAGPEQQVVEVEFPGLPLRRFVARDERPPSLFLCFLRLRRREVRAVAGDGTAGIRTLDDLLSQLRRQVGPRLSPEGLQPFAEVLANPEEVHGAAAVLHRQSRMRPEHPLTGFGRQRSAVTPILDFESREGLFHPVRIPSSGFLPHPDLAFEFRGVGERADEPVDARLRRRRREHPHDLGERRQTDPGDGVFPGLFVHLVLVEQSAHRFVAVVALRRFPRRRQFPMIQEAPGRLPQQVHGVVPPPAAAEEARDARSRPFQLLPEPVPEQGLEERGLPGAGEDGEVGVHSRLDRVLVQQLAAEGVDGAEGGLLQRRAGLLQARRDLRFRFLRHRLVESPADAQPEFAGGALGEGDRDDPGHLRPPGAHQFHDPRDERGGLPGSRGRVHDQGGVQIRTDLFAGAGVREGLAGALRCRRGAGRRGSAVHGSFRMACTSPRAAPSGFLVSR